MKTVVVLMMGALLANLAGASNPRLAVRGFVTEHQLLKHFTKQQVGTINTWFESLEGVRIDDIVNQAAYKDDADIVRQAFGFDASDSMLSSALMGAAKSLNLDTIKLVFKLADEHGIETYDTGFGAALMYASSGKGGGEVISTIIKTASKSEVVIDPMHFGHDIVVDKHGVTNPEKYMMEKSMAIKGKIRRDLLEIVKLADKHGIKIDAKYFGAVLVDTADKIGIVDLADQYDVKIDAEYFEEALRKAANINDRYTVHTIIDIARIYDVTINFNNLNYHVTSP